MQVNYSVSKIDADCDQLLCTEKNIIIVLLVCCDENCLYNEYYNTDL